MKLQTLLSTDTSCIEKYPSNELNPLQLSSPLTKRSENILLESRDQLSLTSNQSKSIIANSILHEQPSKASHAEQLFNAQPPHLSPMLSMPLTSRAKSSQFDYYTMHPSISKSSVEERIVSAISIAAQDETFGGLIMLSIAASIVG